METHDFCIFSGLFKEQKDKKTSFEIEIFCNILNVFTVTFDQFNAYLLNKNINLFLKTW